MDDLIPEKEQPLPLTKFARENEKSKAKESNAEKDKTFIKRMEQALSDIVKDRDRYKELRKKICNHQRVDRYRVA